ncbi:MAG: twin-arginine translocase TatA/TatE family subunit [Gammaproteobacteria bacterium]
MGISIWQLLIILAIVLVLFGAKRLSSLGSDLGSAVKGFKKAVHDEEGKDVGSEQKIESQQDSSGQGVDNEAASREKDQT